jgi:hypothetical protein
MPVSGTERGGDLARLPLSLALMSRRPDDYTGLDWLYQYQAEAS